MPGFVLVLAVNLAWAVLVVVPVLLTCEIRNVYRRRKHPKGAVE